MILAQYKRHGDVIFAVLRTRTTYTLIVFVAAIVVATNTGFAAVSSGLPGKVAEFAKEISPTYAALIADLVTFFSGFFLAFLVQVSVAVRIASARRVPNSASYVLSRGEVDAVILALLAATLSFYSCYIIFTKTQVSFELKLFVIIYSIIGEVMIFIMSHGQIDLMKDTAQIDYINLQLSHAEKVQHEKVLKALDGAKKIPFTIQFPTDNKEAI